MSAMFVAEGGNPIVVIHDDDAIRDYFIRDFLEGLKVEVTTVDQGAIPMFVTGSDTDPDDGFPVIVGDRLNSDFTEVEPRERIGLHWQTIVKIEV